MRTFSMHVPHSDYRSAIADCDLAHDSMEFDEPEFSDDDIVLASTGDFIEYE